MIDPASPEVCHAVRYRVSSPPSDATLSAHLDEALASLRTTEARDVPSARLWVESLPMRAETPLARSRRDAELDRELGPRDADGLRTVLLRYQDHVADLILVARRALFDERALQRLGRAILQGAARAGTLDVRPTAREQHAPAATLDDLRAGGYSAHPEWGLGGEAPGRGTGRLRGAFLPDSLERATLVAALGFVLARFGQHDAPVVASLADDDVALLPMPRATATNVAGFVAEVRRRLTASPCWHTPQLAQALAEDCDEDGEVTVGLCFPADEPTVDWTEYRACLGRPFALTVLLDTAPTGATRLAYAFDLERFAPAMIEAFDEAVGVAVRSFSANPAMPLAAVPLLDPTAASRVAVLGRPAATFVDAPTRIETCVAERAAAHPDAPALSYEGCRLTYGELDRLANQMAHALRAQGVRAGDRVGVCLERSLNLVLTLLAIMKAGATYVPMDPAYPADRLAYTIQDAGLAIVVTELRETPGEGSFTGLQPARLRELARHAPTSAPAHAAGPDDAAYVIYTSGSTGRPKGVVVPHRNVAALITATRDDFGLGSSDTWTLFHSSAFDFSVWEIWGCLMTGGHLVVVPYWTSRSPEELRDLLVRERVTVLNQTPSAFAQLQEADRHGAGRLSLRLVIFGGEALDCRMLLRWFDRHPERACRLVNMFGITETTVHVTAETITRHHALTASRTVGPPLPGWHCYVMDSDQRLLPPGVPGEIYVGGVGVARQYLNRDDLTRERFLRDPFTNAPMYRSGDKGRLRADGRLEHLGRLDGQVKLRGFRIELDEIRSVVLEHPSVVAAAVVLNRTNPDDPASARLDAYVVLEAGTTADVKAHAARVLPDYMQPSSITALTALPLTTNGKLDTRRLPRPTVTVTPASAPMALGSSLPCAVPSIAGLTADASPPASEPLEEVLRRIWKTVMGIEVSIDDNFFELGGNSLYAVRIAAAMRDQKLPSLATRELYVQQTIRRIATLMRGQDSAA